MLSAAHSAISNQKWLNSFMYLTLPIQWYSIWKITQGKRNTTFIWLLGGRYCLECLKYPTNDTDRSLLKDIKAGDLLSTATGKPWSVAARELLICAGPQKKQNPKTTPIAAVPTQNSSMMDNYVERQLSDELMENKHTLSTVLIHLVCIHDLCNCPVLVPESGLLDSLLTKFI